MNPQVLLSSLYANLALCYMQLQAWIQYDMIQSIIYNIFNIFIYTYMLNVIYVTLTICSIYDS